MKCILILFWFLLILSLKYNISLIQSELNDWTKVINNIGKDILYDSC